MSDRLAIVVPCYNEEEVLPISIPELLKVLDELTGQKKISTDSYLLFVNDGSRDRTWELLEEAHQKDSRVRAVKLAKNCGHQSALIAGLMTAKEDADMTVSIDADLQDDTSVIREMVEEYHNGCEIVYGVRGSRRSDSFFKRTTAEGFYKLLAALGVKTVFNHADFRLMSAKALNELAEYKETNLYLRGLIPLLGLKTGKVVYERKERLAGESNILLKRCSHWH